MQFVSNAPRFQATDLIAENIKEQTEMGRKVHDLLLRGESVSDQMVAKMIDDKINSPECAHHGYILDGFPSHTDDASFNISHQMDMLRNWRLQPDFVINLRV